MNCCYFIILNLFIIIIAIIKININFKLSNLNYLIIEE